MTCPAENGASSPAERRAGKEARDEHSNPHTKGEEFIKSQSVLVSNDQAEAERAAAWRPGKFTHFGDPCIHCGLPMEEFAPGPCLGDFSKAKVIGYAVLETRWDGVEHYRYRTSDNAVHEVHQHVTQHGPYYHFGRSDELIQPPPYDARLKAYQQDPSR